MWYYGIVEKVEGKVEGGVAVSNGGLPLCDQYVEVLKSDVARGRRILQIQEVDEKAQSHAEEGWLPVTGSEAIREVSGSRYSTPHLSSVRVSRVSTGGMELNKPVKRVP